MVKDPSDSERGNPLPPHRLLFSISSKDRIVHTTAFVTPVVEHWLEREIAQWVHPIHWTEISHLTLPRFCDDKKWLVPLSYTVDKNKLVFTFVFL